MVRPRRQDGLHLPLVGEESRDPARPVRRPSGHRHLQHLLRAHALQQPLPHARRAGEDRRLRGGRLSPRVSRDVPGRDDAAAHGDALSQPRLHGRRGIDPRQSHRRRRAAHGLRQDDTVAADGRVVVRPADDRRLRRPDALGLVQGPAHRLGHQHLVALGRPSRRQDHAGRIPRGRELHASLPRPLHGDGHGLHDGLDGGGARRRAARQRRLSRGRCAPQRHRAHGRAPHRRDGGAGRDAFEDPHARGLRERDPRERGDRRLDQRRDPPDRDRAAHRREARPRGLGRARPRRAHAREPHAQRQVPHGGLLLRGRASRS